MTGAPASVWVSDLSHPAQAAPVHSLVLWKFLPQVEKQTPTVPSLWAVPARAGPAQLLPVPAPCWAGMLCLAVRVTPGGARREKEQCPCSRGTGGAVTHRAGRGTLGAGVLHAGRGVTRGAVPRGGHSHRSRRAWGSPRAESDEEEALPRIVGGDKRIRGRRNGAHMEVSVAGRLWKEQARARPS